MPTRKIADLPNHDTCRDPAHDPPTMMLFEPGVYEHTCPSCGHATRFVVPRRTQLEMHKGFLKRRLENLQSRCGVRVKDSVCSLPFGHDGKCDLVPENTVHPLYARSR
jgi:hypothetical protein